MQAFGLASFTQLNVYEDDSDCHMYQQSILLTADQNYIRASLVAQLVKNLPAIQETQVESLGQEDPLEKVMATHFSILAWRMPWTEKPGRLLSMGSQRVGHD